MVLVLLQRRNKSVFATYDPNALRFTESLYKDITIFTPWGEYFNNHLNNYTTIV